MITSKDLKQENIYVIVGGVFVVEIYFISHLSDGRRGEFMVSSLDLVGWFDRERFGPGSSPVVFFNVISLCFLYPSV